MNAAPHEKTGPGAFGMNCRCVPRFHSSSEKLTSEDTYGGCVLLCSLSAAARERPK
jgi:hypothetical protein